MNGEESKKIIEAMGTVGFDVIRLELEHEICGSGLTGRVIIVCESKKQEAAK